MSETKYIAKPRLKEILLEDIYKRKFPTQKDLAYAVGVKEPTISRFDTQNRYDINTLISISRTLGLTVEDLFSIEENPNYANSDSVKKDAFSEQVIQIMRDLNADGRITLNLPSNKKDLTDEEYLNYFIKQLSQKPKKVEME